jgi:hypothetical protein
VQLGIERTILATKSPAIAAAIGLKNPGKLASRIRGGKAASRAGDYFERAILAGVRDEAGEFMQLAALPKCGARFTGPGKAHPLPIACDFIGSVVGAGIGVFFDAKSSDDEYGFNLANDKLLKDHQAKYLHRQARAGAIAGILVECRHLGDYRWLHGTHLGPGRAYTAWKDERWLILGETTQQVRMRELVKAYLGENR